MGVADYSILCGGALLSVLSNVSPVEIKHIVNDSGARFVYVDDEENLKKIKSVWRMPTLEKVIFMKDDYAEG